MEKKKGRNKLITAVCVMCVAFLAVTGALIGVLAASTQTIGSVFSVGYNIGDNVAVAVGACFQDMAGGTTWFEGTSSNGTGTINTSTAYAGLYQINVTETVDRGFTLNGSGIIAPEENNSYIGDTYGVGVINFFVQNLTEQKIQCVFTDNCEITNLEVVYTSASDFPFTSYTKEYLEEVSNANGIGAYLEEFSLDENNSYTRVVESKGLCVFEIWFCVEDPNFSASYESSMLNGISISVTQYTGN